MTIGPAGALPGWTVVAGDVDVNTANPFGQPYEGAQWLDLNGNTPGTISQSFATTAGTTYDLSFFYANNTATGGASARVAVVGAGSSLLLFSDFSHAGSTTDNMDYQLFSRSFTADSTTSSLIFESSYSGPSGVALDGVSVTTAVPVPNAFHLFAIGCVCLLGYSRRASRRQFARG